MPYDLEHWPFNPKSIGHIHGEQVYEVPWSSVDYIIFGIMQMVPVGYFHEHR